MYLPYLLGLDKRFNGRICSCWVMTSGISAVVWLLTIIVKSSSPCLLPELLYNNTVVGQRDIIALNNTCYSQSNIPQQLDRVQWYVWSATKSSCNLKTNLKSLVVVYIVHSPTFHLQLLFVSLFVCFWESWVWFRLFIIHTYLQMLPYLIR